MTDVERIATAPKATSTFSPVMFACHRLTPVCSPLDGVSLNCNDAWRVESSVRPSSSAAIPFASINVATVVAASLTATLIAPMAPFCRI